MKRFTSVRWLLILALSVIAVMVTALLQAYMEQAYASPANVAYFAVYCTQGGGLSTLYVKDNVLTCHQPGPSPLFEASVGSLTTNPNGAHFVTIVEADCYPDTPQVSEVPGTTTERISCGSAPDATLTLGSTFAAAAAPPPPPPPPTCSGVSVSDALGTSGNCVGSSTLNPIFAVLDIIITLGTGVFGLILVLMIVIAGLEYVTSGGNADKSKGAKNRLQYVATGFALFVLMWGVLQFLLPNGVFH